MTVQSGDRLLLDGEILEIGCPRLPFGHPRLIEFAEHEVRGKTRDLVLNTGCQRRYVATWAIRDERLYLEDCVGIYRLDGEGPLLAEWVKEKLRIPQGEVLLHVGFDLIQERDLILDIKYGKVVSREVVCNRAWANYLRPRR
jgi:hypothetical protein